MNVRNQNLGARWLRNDVEGSSLWESENRNTVQSITVQGGDKVDAMFMEVDG